MIGITLSAEQIRSAPPEVRRWIEAEIAATVTALHPVTPDPQVQAAMLAPCGPQDAARLFEALRGDHALAQLFLELGREGGHAMPGGLVAHRAGDVMQHSRIEGRDRLLAGLATIERAFHAVRQDADGALLGMDRAGNVYVHETTCRSIAALWARLLSAGTGTAPAAEPAGPPLGVVPASGPSMPVHFGPAGDAGSML
jgi:hypothetical protein